MVCNDGTTTNKKALSKAEKAWMREIMNAAHPGTARIAYRVVKHGNEKYIQGYCRKDLGLDHSVIFNIGLSEDEQKAGDEGYMSKATGYFKSSNKINKTPHKKIRKQVAFKAGNLFMLASWFISQHGLEHIAPLLTLSHTIAYALTTKRYRLDDSIVTGRSGKPLDPIRATAFFELAMRSDSESCSENVPLLVSLIDKVLYNSAPPLPSWAPSLEGLPSPAELQSKYSLADAKELSHNVQCAKQTPPRTGRAIVVDYLNFPESRAVAEAMTQAGLQTTTLFNVAQATSYQCGDNAAAWACMLRQLGQHFTELTHDVASTINNPEYAHAQRRRLGKYRDDTMEAWLDGDEIVSLVMYDNMVW